MGRTNWEAVEAFLNGQAEQGRSLTSTGRQIFAWGELIAWWKGDMVTVLEGTHEDTWTMVKLKRQVYQGAVEKGLTVGTSFEKPS